MSLYKHKVQYYETDKMGITHHSNYIRWMKEARTDFLEKCGWSYKKLESMGVISPVTAVNFKYKKGTTFSDIIEIESKVLDLTKVRLTMSYVMYNEDKEIVGEGQSEHCFVNEKGKIINVAKEYPEFYATMENYK